MIYLSLFVEFFKTGLFAVGGGLATIPFLTDIADRTGWFTRGELLNMIAVGESTPGPIGVNMATYAGFQTGGVLGSIIATLGLIAPSLIVILIVAQFLKRFSENKFVKAAMYGLRACSCALITAAGLSVAAETMVNMECFPSDFLGFFNFKVIILFVVLAFAMNHKKLKKLHPIVFLAASAVIGIVFRFAGV